MRWGSEQLPPWWERGGTEGWRMRWGPRRSGPIPASLTVTTHTLPCTNTCVVLYISGPLWCRPSAKTHTLVYTHSTGLNVPAETHTDINRGFPQPLSGAICPPGSASLTLISGVRLALASEHPYTMPSQRKGTPCHNCQSAHSVSTSCITFGLFSRFIKTVAFAQFTSFQWIVKYD